MTDNEQRAHDFAIAVTQSMLNHFGDDALKSEIQCLKSKDDKLPDALNTYQMVYNHTLKRLVQSPKNLALEKDF